LEYDLLAVGAIDSALDMADLTISSVTAIACIYIVIVMSYWWWKLRVSATNLRALILGIALAKFAIGYWTILQIQNIIFYNVDLPNWSLTPRLLIMVAALMQVWVTMRIKPAPKIESIPGPFER
jgi:hypothetical protein